MNSKKDAKARLLLRLMHDLSEEHWCAQWFTGCEYALWADLAGTEVSGKRPWGISEEAREELRILQKLADGLFVWSDETRGPAFLTTNAWLKHLANIKPLNKGNNYDARSPLA